MTAALSLSVDANPPIALCMDSTDHDCLHFPGATFLFVASPLHPVTSPKDILHSFPSISSILKSYIFSYYIRVILPLFLLSSSPSPCCVHLFVPLRCCFNLLFSCCLSLFPLPFSPSYFFFVPLLTSNSLANDKTSR